MCGIFGHSIAEDWDESRSLAALHTLAHRGPDDEGCWHDDSLFLGHRRLSIIDLSDAGKQPMVSEDSQTILIANGEIYNYQALRKELEKKHTFISESDSEVLLHGYRAWGMDGLLQRIDGIFAFAIYDVKAGQLHLARDHLGVKPLYYGTVDNQFMFASELKPLTSLTDRLNIDTTALYDFLSYNYIPTPKTVYQEIKSLPPAHRLSYNITSGEIELLQYWHVPTETNGAIASPEEAATKLRELLNQSIKKQLVSDAPLGVFLSSGLDSSTVTAFASQHHQGINSYTIQFPDPAKDESEVAANTANHFGTTHHTSRYKAESRVAEKLLATYDQPFADLSALPSIAVSKLAAEHGKVALSGDGGDELFGGYPWYQQFSAVARSNLLQWLGRQTPIIRLISRYRALACHFITDPLGILVKLKGGLVKEEKTRWRKRLNIPDDYDDYWHYRAHYREDLPLPKRLQYLDLHTYLPDDILTKMDRASMSQSLEVRVPLLDKTLVEFAFTLPDDALHSSRENKSLLRAAMRDTLPKELFHQPKRGFGVGTKASKKIGLRALKKRMVRHYAG